MKPQLGGQTVLSADAGYHSEAGRKALVADGIDAYLPDQDYRKRDERDRGQEVHQAKSDPLWDQRAQEAKETRFKPADLHCDPEQRTCLGPAGKSRYGNGAHCTINGYRVIKFEGAKPDCQPGELRPRCLRTPDKTSTRQVAFLPGKQPGHESHTDRMQAKIDSPPGKAMITRRFATVEPVFGNLRNKRLDRLTLRGRKKVDGQWKLYCLVHNIEKLANPGLAQ